MKPEVVRRNNARTRWFHAGVYVLVLVLLFTGWWLTLGEEGNPSVLSTLTGLSDAEIHTDVGYAFSALAVVGIVLGWRAARTLLVDSARFQRGDLKWFAKWPAAVFTGRFTRHDGHFDPGQRIMNWLLVVLLATLTVTGIGLATSSGGPAFVVYREVHIWSTYLFTVVIAGHIVVAAGVLPGYRGVWRAMHLGGRLRVRDAARVWPGWLERERQHAAPAERAGEPEAADERETR